MGLSISIMLGFVLWRGRSSCAGLEGSEAINFAICRSPSGVDTISSRDAQS